MSSADHYVAMDRERKKGFFGFIKYHLAVIFFGDKVHDYNEDERIKGFIPRKFGAFGEKLESNEQAEERIKQKRLIKASDKLLKNGWAVEIVSATNGIPVAFATVY
jgi:hypothetical protein